MLPNEQPNINAYNRIRVSLVSPETILKSWSKGEVTKPETINYRSLKPERDGLFCARIFGPVNDWECQCGKYKRQKFKGVTCEKCGVEVTKKAVRRERMGHIQLLDECPVAHVWFFKGVPSRIAYLLDITSKDLEKVLYFETYIAINPPMESNLEDLEILSEDKYRDTTGAWPKELPKPLADWPKRGDGPGFKIGMGARAIKEHLKRLNNPDYIMKADDLRKWIRRDLVLDTAMESYNIMEILADLMDEAGWEKKDNLEMQMQLMVKAGMGKKEILQRFLVVAGLRKKEILQWFVADPALDTMDISETVKRITAKASNDSNDSNDFVEALERFMAESNITDKEAKEILRQIKKDVSGKSITEMVIKIKEMDNSIKDMMLMYYLLEASQYNKKVVNNILKRFDNEEAKQLLKKIVDPENNIDQNPNMQNPRMPKDVINIIVDEDIIKDIKIGIKDIMEVKDEDVKHIDFVQSEMQRHFLPKASPEIVQNLAKKLIDKEDNKDIKELLGQIEATGSADMKNKLCRLVYTAGKDDTVMTRQETKENKKQHTGKGKGKGKAISAGRTEKSGSGLIDEEEAEDLLGYLDWFVKSKAISKDRAKKIVHDSLEKLVKDYDKKITEQIKGEFDQKSVSDKVIKDITYMLLALVIPEDSASVEDVEKFFDDCIKKELIKKLLRNARSFADPMTAKAVVRLLVKAIADDTKKMVEGRLIDNLSGKLLLLYAEIIKLRHAMKELAMPAQKRTKVAKRLKTAEAFKKSRILCEWMIPDVIPVLPPELRPLVPLDGGRFATSDLNDLYRRVINRNNRLKKLKELGAPEVIQRNEMRMLQEAADALFENGKRGRLLKGVSNRPLKSLSDALKGKQGRFRQNLLGKRVDYSGRSVIVVGPDLKLHQCGLPKKMALELFKPFIFNRLEHKGFAATIRQAKEMVERGEHEVWDILDEVIQNHPVLLNRAPTLHRLGIQAFQPILVEGKAIRLHPLVCTAFNADFDGDQMAVHVPLSPMAQIEAKVLMMSTQNILNPANGRPNVVPSQDIVLGAYYLTKKRLGRRGEGMVFGNIDQVVSAHDAGVVDTHSIISLRYTGDLIDTEAWHKSDPKKHSEQEVFECPVRSVKNEMITTTVGRIIFNRSLPDSIPFVNGLIKKDGLLSLVNRAYKFYGPETTILMLDALKDVGFLWAMKAGVSVGIDDLVVPKTKQELLRAATEEVRGIEHEYYEEGKLDASTRTNLILEVWSKAADQVASDMMKDLELQNDTGKHLNSIFIMADSGARGSRTQIRQVAGMRGLMAKPSGDIIETPIMSNFKEGLTVLEYFTSTHGARKGLADTALKTANSGYLTRKLVDVAQDVVINKEDCNTMDSIEVAAIVNSDGTIRARLRDRIMGRVAAEDVTDPYSKKTIAAMGTLITEELAFTIETSGIQSVKIRSVLTCESETGVCAKCYGLNLSTGRLVDLGEAVGTVAAQSIGEPGTQLTMRTFHVGGAASRASEKNLHEAQVKGVVKLDGISRVKNHEGSFVALSRKGNILVLDQDDRHRVRERYKIPPGAIIKVEDGDLVEPKTVLAEWDPYNDCQINENAGVAYFEDFVEGVSYIEEKDPTTGRYRKKIIYQEEKKDKEKGADQGKQQQLTPRVHVVDESLHRLFESHKSEGHKPEGDKSRGDNKSKGEYRLIDIERELIDQKKLHPEDISKGKDKLGKLGDILDKLSRRGAIQHYNSPTGAYMEVEDGGALAPGDVLSKRPREVAKTSDITGGLTRVTELFEGRKPKDPAILSRVNGTLRHGNRVRGNQKVMVEYVESDPETGKPEKKSEEYSVPKGKHIQFPDGDEIEAGDKLTEGAVSPHDILEIHGEKELQAFLLNEVQEVYRAQGVAINDKHIEIIIRQMMRWVQVTDVGDTRFIVEEKVDKHRFDKINERVIADGGAPATKEPLLLGITKAALTSESFISAASFQETARVLTEAALEGRTDLLKGLKENVILGRLIPAGTGLAKYRNIHIEEGQYPVPVEPVEDDTDDFDDEYSRMAVRVEELQGLTETDFDQI